MYLFNIDVFMVIQGSICESVLNDLCLETLVNVDLTHEVKSKLKKHNTQFTFCLLIGTYSSVLFSFYNSRPINSVFARRLEMTSI